MCHVCCVVCVMWDVRVVRCVGGSVVGAVYVCVALFGSVVYACLCYCVVMAR